MGTDKIYQLDETTLYSVLGLKYGASEVQIRKSYMKLARELHPDKSKSEEAAELFKKVAHAHVVLTDKKEKMKYDAKLLSKGLYDYTPKMTQKMNKQPGTQSKVDVKGSHSQQRPNNAPNTATKQKSRKSKPYEEQPYGFGVDSNRASNKNIPLFKTFNAKSYQNSKNSTTTPPKQTDGTYKRATSFSFENRGEDGSIRSNNQKINGKNGTNGLGSGIASGTRVSSSGSESSTSSISAPGSSEEPESYVRSKIPRKSDTKNETNINKRGPDSPFVDSNQRHFARTKYETNQYYRRSVSPVRNTPNSSTETLNNVKNIFNSMSDRLRHTLFGDNPDLEDNNGQDIEKEARKSKQPDEKHFDRHGNDKNKFKRSKTEGRKILSDEEVYQFLKEERPEVELTDPDRQEFNSSINLNTENFDDGVVGFDTQDKNQDLAPDASNVKSENAEEDSIRLEELHETLPSNKEPFDMRNVGDTLDDYHVKRIKISKQDTHVSLESSTLPGSSHIEENLHLQEPVNMPLPKIYKPETIPLDNFQIDLSIANLELPEIPNFYCNVSDKAQVLECQKKTIEFSRQSNETKRKLLLILSQRFSADEALHDKLHRVENANNVVHARRYDIELVTKLNELQNRQRIVAENHANLMNTIYSLGLRGNGR